MAGKRVYVMLPKRDAELLRHLGLESQECVGMIARRFILERLYHHLEVSSELQEYDAQLARQERQELIRGR